MNGIQEAINAMTAEQWGQALAQAVVMIISVYAAFVVIQQAKRLLEMVDDPDIEGKTREQIIEESWSFDGEPEYYMAMHGMSADEIDRAMYPSFYSEEDGDAMTEAEYHEDYHQFLTETDPEEAADYAEEHGLDLKSEKEDLFWEAVDRHDFQEAKSLNEDFSLGIEDFEGLVKAKAQACIDVGDFQTADDLCNEWGIDKLELEWH